MFTENFIMTKSSQTYQLPILHVIYHYSIYHEYLLKISKKKPPKPTCNIEEKPRFAN